jgi:hypothetical protein
MAPNIAENNLPFLLQVAGVFSKGNYEACTDNLNPIAVIDAKKNHTWITDFCRNLR